MKKKITSSEAETFLKVCGSQQLIHMFDILPDILFWIKNQHSQIMYANQSFCEHIGVSTPEQAIGVTDFDFAPPHLARQFVQDDQRVMAGNNVDDRLEMNITSQGTLSWFTTSKRPLYNDQGGIIGSYGTSRHLEKTSLAFTGMQALKTPVEYIRSHFMKDICVVELAAIAHLSVSALERRFKKYLHKTPKQFINEIRLEHARKLLVETTLPVALVANESGFSDPSYFTRQFSRLFGVKPSEFRRSYQA
ncbi:AraC family transcriptional regulator [Gayadomonas joobiniege]|uniref:AraC family transcriptional regulator n=1 Tax=Gayadomonas joobiniege TaxID=1234606 RepID=UPI000374E0CA|nr:AraC family transcriptional regulator [Gayadomonas joobiniege]